VVVYHDVPSDGDVAIDIQFRGRACSVNADSAVAYNSQTYRSSVGQNYRALPERSAIWNVQIDVSAGERVYGLASVKTNRAAIARVSDTSIYPDISSSASRIYPISSQEIQ
jgi:hypothetical protein